MNCQTGCEIEEGVCNFKNAFENLNGTQGYLCRDAVSSQVVEVKEDGK